MSISSSTQTLVILNLFTFGGLTAQDPFRQIALHRHEILKQVQDDELEGSP